MVDVCDWCEETESIYSVTGFEEFSGPICKDCVINLVKKSFSKGINNVDRTLKLAHELDTRLFEEMLLDLKELTRRHV